MKKFTTAKYPEKTSINLAMRDENADNVKFSLGGFAIFMVVLALFTKFAVIDRLNEANAAEAAYMEVQSQIATLRETNEAYDQVKEEYSHYSNSFLNEEELAEADRIQVLDLLEKCVLPSADVQSLQVTGNAATLTINDTTLNTVSDIVKALESDSRTDYVTVSTAATSNQENAGNQFVTANIVINLKSTGGEES